MKSGVVSFVGLGPGDPTLRVPRAAERIAGADAVVDDAKPNPERLIELAREGKRVVRLFEGDALESPAAAAEIIAVARAGVSIEVVPGVGARGAVAAFAGVLGRAVRVAASDVERAVASEARDAVVTLVAQVGSPSQRVTVTTASGAAAHARALGDADVIVAFGAPEESLRWFERRPLFGKRVLVTRAREGAEAAATVLREYGAEPLAVPAIEIRSPSDPSPLAHALEELKRGAFGWVAFTSANGVERTWNALVFAGADARVFGHARLAAIGPATARALDRHGLRADLVAREFRGEALAEEMRAAIRQGGGPCRVLLARAARARDVLPRALRAAGCVVDVVSAYETHAPSHEAGEALARELEAGRIDAVTFASSSAVENLCDLLGSRAVELIQRARIASIGPVTAETARARGLRVDVTARVYTVPGLVQALAESYG